jgi:hypothetical protein
MHSTRTPKLPKRSRAAAAMHVRSLCDACHALLILARIALKAALAAR